MAKVIISIEDDQGHVEVYQGQAMLGVLDVGEDYQVIIGGPGEGLGAEDVGPMLMTIMDGCEDHFPGISEIALTSMESAREDEEEEEDDIQIIDLTKFFKQGGDLS